MAIRVCEIGFVLLMFFGRLTCVEPARVSLSDICPVISITDSIVGFGDFCLEAISFSERDHGADFVVVMEGDDVSLQMALNLIYNNSKLYVAVLFYASWCPFSRTCRPTFASLSSLYPSIRHFAVEESAIRPSILSRYGVRGFPTLFLLNSTMRVRYHGSRTLKSLVTFYSDVTGIKPASLDQMSLEKKGNPLNLAKIGDTEQENCPFTWARSPENLLRQETYLALATTFVLLRLLYFLVPSLLAHARCAWRRHTLNTNLMSLWEHPLAYLIQATQVFNVLRRPCKRSNLQEGAMNARAWASKSLASVSIGDASSSRGCLGGSERR